MTDVVSDRLSDGLLGAVVALASNLELDEVLAHIVASACELTGAPYGALGVLSEAGPADSRFLAGFHQHGVPPAQAELIGNTPHGRGVLGLLIDDPQPIRLDQITEHPAFEGYPPHHPRLETFLGVPIRVRGEIFGNLYLADKAGGFSAADETVVTGLAAAAGVAIHNARLFGESRRRQRWLAAATRVSESAADLSRLAQTVAELAAEAGTCDAVAVALPTATAEEELLVSTRGAGADFVLNGATGAAARWLGTAVPNVPDAADRLPGGLAPPSPGTAHVDFTLGGDRIGLLVCQRDQPAWSEVELASVRAFADHVALATDHARNEHNRRRLAVFSDRDRIARDLHDQVIQRIFAVGLSLQGASRRLAESDIRDRIDRAIVDLDATIREIRTTIYFLHHVADAQPRSLRSDVLAVVADAGRALDEEPQVTLVGPIDEALPGHLAEDALATLRESLSNVARHAEADEVMVLVRADAQTFTVQVEDNGVGLDPSHATGSGLRNAAARAVSAGGRFSVARRAQGGTSFTWKVPLPA